MLRRQTAPVGESVGATPRFSFSPVESLESSMSLMSGVVDQPQEITDKENGTRENRFKDGRVEVWYSNGNRYSILFMMKTSVLT